LEPTLSPTQNPTISPTSNPTWSPSLSPSLDPPSSPSTESPTFSPTFNPTLNPILKTSAPVASDPTLAPTFAPTFAPSLSENSPSPTECELVPKARSPARLEPEDASEQYRFGTSIDLASTTAIIGAPFSESLPTVSSGAAYVFDLNDGVTWDFTEKLTASFEINDRCGESVAIGGPYAFVGCPLNDESATEKDSGAVYIFERDGATGLFELVGALPPPPGIDSVWNFGWSIAVNNGALTIAVGARGAREGRGSVFLYQLVGEAQWELVESLEPNVDLSQTNGGNFGWDVAVDNANTVVVGAPFEEERGALFIYKQDAPNSWGEFDKVAPDDLSDGAAFGFSVALDNSIALIGARNALLAGNENAGAAYIYEIPGGPNGPAVFKQRLTASSPTEDAFYGQSVALKDGRLVIGSPATNGPNAIYFYYQDSDDSWVLSERVLPRNPNNQLNVGIQYGAAVAVTEEALMVGAPNNDLNGTDSGSVFTYIVVEDNVCGDGALSPILPRSPSLSFEIPINLVSSLIPVKRYMDWLSLSATDREIAQVYLGYSKNTWNIPGSNEIEEEPYESLSEDGKAGAAFLGFSENIWDCHINHYYGYWWEQLEEQGLVQYLIALGWDESSWNDGPSPETDDLYWDDLTLDEQSAASGICYFKDLWDDVPIDQWELLQVP